MSSARCIGEAAYVSDPPFCGVAAAASVEQQTLDLMRQRLAHVELLLAPLVAAEQQQRQSEEGHAANVKVEQREGGLQRTEAAVDPVGPPPCGNKESPAACTAPSPPAASNADDTAAASFALVHQICDHLTALECRHGIRVRPRGEREVVPLTSGRAGQMEVAGFISGTGTDSAGLVAETERSPSDRLLAAPPVLDPAARRLHQTLALAGVMDWTSDDAAAAAQLKHLSAQLAALEAMQQRYGHRLHQHVERCERLLPRLDALLDFSSSKQLERSALGLPPPLRGDVLQAWIDYNPTYAFPFHPGTGAASSAPRSRVPQEQERAMWERVGHVTGNRLDSGAPRQLSDAYALAQENQQRYAAVQQRWALIKRTHLELTQYANELLCSVTLKLDALEERQREAAEAKAREEAREEEEANLSE
eukprot:gene8789-6176_t